MASRRVLCLFLVLLASFCAIPISFFSKRTTPFLSERSSRDLPDVRIPECSERAEHVSRLLLSPVFLFHALWIVGLVLLSLYVATELFFKLVYCCCSAGVCYVTGGSQLPLTTLRYAIS